MYGHFDDIIDMLFGNLCIISECHHKLRMCSYTNLRPVKKCLGVTYLLYDLKMVTNYRKMKLTASDSTLLAGGDRL